MADMTLTVKSQTDPKITYLLRVAGEDITCTCKGFTFNNTCKHAETLRLVLEEQCKTDK